MKLRDFLIYLLITLINISQCANENVDQQNVLSRKKRYLVFPEGASFSIAVCMTIGMYGNPQWTLFSWALNYGFAYELPHNASLWLRLRQDYIGTSVMEEDKKTPAPPPPPPPPPTEPPTTKEPEPPVPEFDHYHDHYFPHEIYYDHDHEHEHHDHDHNHEHHDHDHNHDHPFPDFSSPDSSPPDSSDPTNANPPPPPPSDPKSRSGQSSRYYPSYRTNQIANRNYNQNPARNLPKYQKNGNYRSTPTGFGNVNTAPVNRSNKNYPYVTTHMLQRRFRRELYNRLEIAMDKMGYDGRECMKRALCHSPQVFGDQGSNMISEIIRTVFSLPKSRILSSEQSELHLYEEAFNRGQKKVPCHLAYPRCRFSLIDLALGKYSKPLDNYM